MKTVTHILIIVLSLALLLGCSTATATPTAAITATPIPPTPTEKVLPPTAVPATATVALPERQPDWTFAAGGPIMSPIMVADGVAYFGCEDTYLYAVDIASHDLKWKFKTEGAIRSRPALSTDLVFAASDDSYLYAVSIADGAEVWKTQIEPKAITRVSGLDPEHFDPYTSSPALLDTTLYIGSTDSNLYALDASSGNVLWKFATAKGSVIRNTPSIADGKVYFADKSGDFYAIDAKKGTKVWVFNADGSNITNGSTVIGQVVYFVTITYNYAVDITSGKVIWDSYTFYSKKTPAYDNGILYLDAYQVSTDILYPMAAYKAENGVLVWTEPSLATDADDLSNNSTASAVVGKNNVYLGLNYGDFYAFDKKTGAIQWKIPARYGIFSTPMIADGIVYFGGMDGLLYAVKDE